MLSKNILNVIPSLGVAHWVTLEDANIVEDKNYKSLGEFHCFISEENKS